MIETAPPPGIRDRLTAGPVVACIDRTTGRSVARIADALARRLRARVLLTTVQQPTPEILTRHAWSLLTSAARGLKQPTDLRLTHGEPSERLLAAAERERAQLVIVSAPRRSPAETLLLGNVYLALAGAASCPVIVIPPGVSTIDVDRPIVCAVDGSPPSQAAADVAADLARRLNSRLLLVHAAPAPGASGGADRAARILQDTAERLDEDVSKSLLVEYGSPVDRLAAVAERERAQLLVTASRGRGGMSSVLLGAVASQLALAAPTPVMVVPSRHSRGRPSAIAAIDAANELMHAERA